MNVPEKVLHICRVLNENGHEAWLVGGAVRDALLGRKTHDWDIATDALPNMVRILFRQVVLTGIKHGTVTVMLGGEGYEVTTYRGDNKYSDGRHPDEVSFLKNIEEDLARRDFTVNAIAYNPLTGEFRDPFGGREDLSKRVLRAVGNPLSRFREDGLRVLRAARFAAILGFNLDYDTISSIRGALDVYAKVSMERVHDEWIKIMQAESPSIAFRIMEKNGILEITVPEFIHMVGCDQNKYHSFDVWEHTLNTVDACTSDDPVLRIAALFHDIGKPIVKGINDKTGEATFYDHEDVGARVTDSILQRMKFSNAERERIVHLVRHHYIRYEHGWSKGTIRRWIRRVGSEHMNSLFALARADIFAKGTAREQLSSILIDEMENRIKDIGTVEPIVTSTRSLAVNGKDVMSHLGIPPGPQVGEVLATLLEAVTDDPALNNRESLMQIMSTIGKGAIYAHKSTS